MLISKWNAYTSSSMLPRLEELEDREECSELLWAHRGHPLHLLTQWLRFPEQDLCKTGPISIPAWLGEDTLGLIQWWLREKGLSLGV